MVDVIQGMVLNTKGPVCLPFVFSCFGGGLMNLGKADFADGGTAAAVTERCVMNEGSD